MSKSVKLEFNIDADDYLSAGAASNKIKETLKIIGIPSDITRRAAIITYEAEMNLVIHGGGGRLVAEIYQDRIQITTDDTGPGIPDISKAVQEGFTTAGEEAREMGFGAGMGLPNIKRNSDSFEITSLVNEGTHLKTTIYLTK